MAGFEIYQVKATSCPTRRAKRTSSLAGVLAFLVALAGCGSGGGESLSDDASAASSAERERIGVGVAIRCERATA